MATRINLIDVYLSYSDLDAGVIETILEGFNISCSVRTIGMMRFSSDTADFPEKRIAVEESKVENARMILSNAIRSGVISKDGRFVV
jgi:hypothetical protein